MQNRFIKHKLPTEKISRISLIQNLCQYSAKINTIKESQDIEMTSVLGLESQIVFSFLVVVD